MISYPSIPAQHAGKAIPANQGKTATTWRKPGQHRPRSDMIGPQIALHAKLAELERTAKPHVIHA
jgi:hypothetical protein